MTCKHVSRGRTDLGDHAICCQNPTRRQNPTRLKDDLLSLTRRGPADPRPFQGLNIADIGSGGGLLSEVRYLWDWLSPTSVFLGAVHSARSLEYILEAMLSKKMHFDHTMNELALYSEC